MDGGRCRVGQRSRAGIVILHVIQPAPRGADIIPGIGGVVIRMRLRLLMEVMMRHRLMIATKIRHDGGGGSVLEPAPQLVGHAGRGGADGRAARASRRGSLPAVFGDISPNPTVFTTRSDGRAAVRELKGRGGVARIHDISLRNTFSTRQATMDLNTRPSPPCLDSIAMTGCSSSLSNSGPDDGADPVRSLVATQRSMDP